MSRGTLATISSGALRHNLAQVRAHAPDSRIWAVVKANAYGHSADFVAEALQADVDGYAVSSLAEAMALREHGIDSPIILLEGVTDAEHLVAAQAHDLCTVFHCTEQLNHLLALTEARPIKAWIKVDTGMHRLGFAPDQVDMARTVLNAHPAIALQGVMTHLACADDAAAEVGTRRQIEQCLTVQQPGEACSIANSAGLVDYPESHQDWVRPGILLYGASPFADRTAADLNLLPVMSLTSPVIDIHTLDVGETVGYGARWQAERRSVIATLAIGYGDGYPRHAPDGTPVWLNGQRVPLVGRVSMDMLTVDVTDLEYISVGDMAELWGSRLPVDTVAASINTIGYELLTRVSPRVPRVLID